MILNFVDEKSRSKTLHLVLKSTENSASKNNTFSSLRNTSDDPIIRAKFSMTAKMWNLGGGGGGGGNENES